MSAWMISDAHLDLLATAWVRFIDPDADPQAIGQALARDCAASIRARYEDRYGDAAEAEAQAEAYRYRPWPGNIDPAMLAKQVACYRYQACETPDWETRDGYAACERFMGRLVAMGVDYDGEPVNSRRFDEYPWGVDEEHRTGGQMLDPAPPQLVLVTRNGETIH